MTFTARTVAVLLCALWAATSPAIAQESGQSAEQPSAQLPIGQEIVDGVEVGKIYVRDTYGDWTLRCTRTPEGQADPCHIYQLMQDDKGNSVAEINLFPLPGDDIRVAGATIAVPLGTLLTEQLTISVDGGSTKRYPFTYCSIQGCYARIGLTAEDIADYKRGASAVLTLVPVAAPNARVAVTLSLKGFTKAFEALQKEQAAHADE